MVSSKTSGVDKLIEKREEKIFDKIKKPPQKVDYTFSSDAVDAIDGVLISPAGKSVPTSPLKTINRKQGRPRKNLNGNDNEIHSLNKKYLVLNKNPVSTFTTIKTRKGTSNKVGKSKINANNGDLEAVTNSCIASDIISTVNFLPKKIEHNVSNSTVDGALISPLKTINRKQGRPKKTSSSNDMQSSSNNCIASKKDSVSTPTMMRTGKLASRKENRIEDDLESIYAQDTDNEHAGSNSISTGNSTIIKTENTTDRKRIRARKNSDCSDIRGYFFSTGTPTANKSRKLISRRLCRSKKNARDNSG